MFCKGGGPILEHLILQGRRTHFGTFAFVRAANPFWNLLCCVCCWAECLTGTIYKKQGKRTIVLLLFGSIFTTKPNQMHALLCWVCCWAQCLTGAIYKNQENERLCYLFLLVYLQLNWIKCTPCFVVCAAGLNSSLVQYSPGLYHPSH